MKPQVKSIEPRGQNEGAMIALTSAEVSMDVCPTVEKPAGGDTEMLGDDDDDTTDTNWPLINLDAS